MKQFKIADIKGVTFKDLQAEEDWLNKYEYTQEQNEQWLKYLRVELKPYAFKPRLEKETQGMNLNYGLKIKG